MYRRSLSFSFNVTGGFGSGRRLQDAGGTECALQAYNATDGSFDDPSFAPCSSPAVRS